VVGAHFFVGGGKWKNRWKLISSLYVRAAMKNVDKVDNFVHNWQFQWIPA
jgi:hypothetical protein